MRVAALLAAAVALTAAATPSAAAQVPDLPIPPLPIPTVVPGPSGPEPLPYGTADGGGFRDVLPSGTRGHYDALELAEFLSTGKTVPHCCDQLGMYGDLVYATPGLQADQVGRYFKDSTFGVPHIYGATRDGAMFGAG